MNGTAKSILYFGSNSPASNARHRADAMKRLGCTVLIVDPASLIAHRCRLLSWLDYRTGYAFLQKRILKNLKAQCLSLHFIPDLIWINSGEYFGPSIMRWLRLKYGCKIVLYNNDDPTGSRDGMRFHSLRIALPYYSLCVFVRQETALEALVVGAKRTLVTYPSYDEIVHLTCQNNLQHNLLQVVSFVGTLIPGEARDQFLVALIKSGLPLRLIGDRWQRSSVWSTLESVYRGPALKGLAYSKALGDSAVSIGFLSHGNRDLMTRRSVETTACGGLLCAERTSAHQLLYEDANEAVFWDSVEECISHSKKLLNHPNLRNKICLKGKKHVRNMGLGNEDILRQILSFV